MTPTQVFSIVNTVALMMWLLMILFPYWKITKRLIELKIVPILLSILYAVYLIISLVKGPAMNFGSLQEVMNLFTIEDAVLVGWIHYLVFDLLVGMWMLSENKSLKIHPVIMAPCLALTFLAGPFGFLIFMTVRAYKKKQKYIKSLGFMPNWING